MMLSLAFPGIVRGTQTINVDLDHGATYSGTAVASDSGTTWNSISGSGTLSPVKDSQGNTLSGVTITLSSSSGVYKFYYDSNSGHPNPSALMSDYTYGATYTYTITGLVPGQAYGLYAYSHGNQDNQTGTITLAAANGGASASTSQTGDSGYFRDISLYGLGYNYVVLNGTADGSGSFTFTVANFLNGFQLQLLSTPAISELMNQTVVAGTGTVLNPVITGVPPPAFQWWSNNVALPDGTNASLTLNNVQYAQNGTVYSLVASNYVGAVTNNMTLSVIVTPAITGLINQAGATGSAVTISPTVSGVPTPTLQWRLDGTNLTDGATGYGSTISGSASSTLSIANAQTEDSGVYSLVASNSAGIATNSMTLTVSSGDVAPTIAGPINQTVVQTSNATFSASVSGLPLPILQWRVNGTDIPDATNSSLTVTNVQYSQNGDIYSLVASNSAGKTTNSATLYVLVPPEISQQPAGLAVTAGSPATFTVGASGVPDVSYHWQRNGTPILGATSAVYTIPSAQGADNDAVFSVVVSNSVDVVTSSNATLTVLSVMTGTFLPTNGAVNIAPDQQLRIVFSSPPHLGSGKLYVRDAADNSVFATIDTSQFQTFTTDSATVTNAFVRTEQGQDFFYMPIAIYGNEAWITLNPTNRFAYGKTYYVTCDTGLFLDSNGAAFQGISGTDTWRFSTKSGGLATPTASTGPTNITVGLDGTGDFATLQGASDWIPQNNTLPRTITILPGVYHDFAIFTQNRNHVTVVGGGANWQDVQLIYPNAAYTSGSSCGLLRVESSDMYFRNLTLDNQVYLTNSLDNYGPWAGRLNTLDTTGQRLIFDHVMIKGGQDTLYTVSGSTYFNHCEIWGSTDFIYGSALSVFDHCNIVEIRDSGGPCTAPHTDYSQPYGLIFLDCQFPQALKANGYPYDVANASTTFMRPWGQDGNTAIINCSVGNQMSTKGWGEWGGKETTCRAREYGTTLISGGTVTPAQRQAAGAYWLNTIDPDYTSSSMSPTDSLLYGSSGTANRVPVTVNPSDYTLSAIFGNSYFHLNGWMPAVIPTITSEPANQSLESGATATFTVAATGFPAPTYQWLKDGTNLTGQTSDTLSLPSIEAGDAGTYSVIVSNSAGSVISSNAVLAVVAPSPPPVPLPQINTNNIINVNSYGAVGDGVTTNTVAIQNAINAAAAGGSVNGLSGGTVEISAGVYLCGPLTLKNDVNLQVDAGANLKMLPYGSFPASSDFISASKLHDIEISGSGTIDGNGAEWWAVNNATSGGISRPKALFAPTGCSNILIRDITLQNPPNTHIGFRASGSQLCANITINHLTINTPDGTPNTDGIDLSGTNVFIANSYISDGDDHIAIGGGYNVVVTNCFFGTGHGCSIGSYTTQGVSNLLVINCTWSGSANGIRVKSQRGRGGLCQSMTYQNLSMTNVQWPILLYSYYNYGVGTLSSATPYMAATDAVQTVTSKTPIWKNITFSNVTATVTGDRPPIMIWGLPEMLISNVVLKAVNISGGTKNCEIYNAAGIQFIDSKISEASGVNTFALYNADVTITNSMHVTSPIKLDGLTTNGVHNTLALYNADAVLQNTNALGAGPLTLGGSIFTVNSNLRLSPTMDLYLALGTNQTAIADSGNLSLGGTLNVSDGGGLADGNYTVLTYRGTLNGNGPTLGKVPTGFSFSVDTNTVGQVNLVVSPPVNSTPTNLTFGVVGNTLELSWPKDHIGWWLQIQTNELSRGLGTNWVTVPDSELTNRMSLPIEMTTGCTFLRLVYPKS